jgi:Holliday junction resolvase RusA-like endonuclease
MATIILKGNPISVNRLYTGRRFLTPRGKAIKDDYYYQIYQQYKGKKLEGDIKVVLTVYFRSKKTSDLDNVLKATLDSMTGSLWKDDRQITEIVAYKKQDKDNPRIEIIIENL